MSTIMSLCVFLRTPPLFIIDKIFNISFGFQDIDGAIITLYNTFGNSIHNKFENGDPVQYILPILLLFYLLIKIIATCLGKFNKLLKKNNITWSIILIMSDSWTLLTIFFKKKRRCKFTDIHTAMHMSLNVRDKS